MDTKRTAKNLLFIIFGVMLISQFVYTFQNITMFNTQYGKLTDEQVKELGQTVQTQVEYALRVGVPLERLGKVDDFLQDVVDGAPDLAFIDIEAGDKVMFSAERSRDTVKTIEVPILAPDNEQVGVIKLGINQEIKRHSRRILFDLFTIVAAALLITYELLIFLTSKIVQVPGEEAVRAANCQIANLEPINYRTNSYELGLFLAEVKPLVESMRRRLNLLTEEIRLLSERVATSVGKGREKLTSLIEEKRCEVARILGGASKFSRIVNPSHVRPVVFTFILGSNLHSSFLPLFARDLLKTPTFLDAWFSEKMLMGLPISAYMITVTLTMLFLGTKLLRNLTPLRALVGSLVLTAVGLVLSGMAQNIVHLILARMLCAVGFAIIVYEGRLFIVDNAPPEKRAYYLAGYTTAFSGGMFCSLIIGGIMADYFSYRIVFFMAAAIMLFVLIFCYVVFAGVESADKGSAKHSGGFGAYMKLCFKDISLLAVTLQGIITRILFVGLFYYCLPIFLKSRFSYADIGRMLMFYGLTSVFLATFLNRSIKDADQGRHLVFRSNMMLGLAFAAFYFIPFDSSAAYVAAAIGGVVIMGVANSITFPSQVNLLLATYTTQKVGNRTVLAVYQSLERVGSALGPIFFGALATVMDIHKAIGFGGALCIVGNILFFVMYRVRVSKSGNN